MRGDLPVSGAWGRAACEPAAGAIGRTASDLAAAAVGGTARDTAFAVIAGATARQVPAPAIGSGGPRSDRATACIACLGA